MFKDSMCAVFVHVGDHSASTHLFRRGFCPSFGTVGLVPRVDRGVPTRRLIYSIDGVEHVFYVDMRRKRLLFDASDLDWMQWAVDQQEDEVHLTYRPPQQRLF